MEVTPGGDLDIRMMREGSTVTILSRDYAVSFPVDAIERIESRVTYSTREPTVREPRA